MSTIENEITERNERAGGGMSVSNFCAWAGIGRTVAYAEIRAGRLRAVKVGRRTIITRADAQCWLANLPALKPAETIAPNGRPHRGQSS